ncbi:MAG: hypothetical protein KIG43_01070 [Eubacteriales bacterium]|nr:hypothetical protein [Eubacteriales bacterium]MDD7550740.1 hypothetical protein [Clostridia bacterium]MDY5754436.1 hypothetical protein [Eubacteriales bacterium]
MQDIWKTSDSANLLKLYSYRIMLVRKPMSYALDKLVEFAQDLDNGDIELCEKHYYELYSHLVTNGCRRISGNLICDLVFHALLLVPHDFAVMASKGKTDDAVIMAMKNDLFCLQQLSTLDTAAIQNMAKEKLVELRSKVRQHKDHTAALSAAAWSGAQMNLAHMQRDDQNSARVFPRMLDYNWPSFDYGEAEFRDEYSADEALGEMYNRLIASEDWTQLTDDLYSFFNQYGYGFMLRSYSLRMKPDGTLVPLKLTSSPHEPRVDTDFSLALDNVISFMRQKPHMHMFICGLHGSGKTEFALKVASELPELRLILIPCGALDNPAHKLDSLMGELSNMPLRFMVLLENPSRELCASVIPCTVPKNVLLCATGEIADHINAFPMCIEMRELSDDELQLEVELRLDELNCTAEPDVIEDACKEAIEISGKAFVSTIDRAVSIVLWKIM